MKKILQVLFVLSVLISSIALPYPVYATTINLTVTGEGGQTDGSYTGGAGNYTNINSDDDDTSYLKWGTIAYPWYAEHSYKFDAFVTSNNGINSVTLTYKVKADSTPGYTAVTPYCRIAGTNYYGTSNNIYGSSYATKTYTWTTNPATGIDWTDSDLNGSYAEFGLKTTVSSQYYTRLTYAYVTVDYNAITAPTVETDNADGIIYDGAFKATLNGNVTADGGGTIDYYGFVWDTSDKGDPGNADPSGPPGTWSNGWKSGVGDYGENPFDHQITGLAISTEYYFRAGAHNSEGWSYGDAVSFRTLGNPSITTLDATNVVATTARLNANVVDDGMLGGGEDCTVVFIHKENAGAHYADYAAILAAGGTEVTAGTTYNTGDMPYYDISGLTVSTNTDFAVKITNSVSTQYGSVLYFTTESGVSVPTSFVAIPTNDSISLSWAKGAGASNTFIRYDTSTYPTTVAGGLATIYAGTGSSYLLEGLTAGKTYYFSAWGLTAGTYSGTYATVMATCLAEGAGTIVDLPQPGTPGSWSNALSVASITNFPFYDIPNYFADDYGIPQTTLWYGLWIVFSVSAALFAYWRGNQNLLVALVVCFLGLVIGANLGLVYLWIGVFFALVGMTMAWMSQRYT